MVNTLKGTGLCYKKFGLLKNNMQWESKSAKIVLKGAKMALSLQNVKSKESKRNVI